MKKPENLRDSSKLDPLIFSGFFCLLRKPGRLCRPDCRLVDLGVTAAVSLLRNPARFSRRKNGIPPRAQPSNNDSRPITQQRDRARETRRKRAGSRGARLLAHSDSDSFSHGLSKTGQPKIGFRGNSREAFDAKAVPRTSPLPANEKAARKNRTAFIIPFMRINRGKYP